MNKKIFAAFLAITAPIWFIPAFFLGVAFMGFRTLYENILKVLEGKAQEKL